MIQAAGVNAEFMIQQYYKKIAKNPGDCGFDLYPMVEKESDVVMEDLGYYERWDIPTKVNVAIPEGFFGMVIARSSSVNKLMGCNVIPGIIDHGYTGEYLIRIQVPIVSVDVIRKWKLLSAIYRLSGNKVALAQCIIVPFIAADFDLVAELKATARGNNGYGSTDSLNTNVYEQQSGGRPACRGGCGKAEMNSDGYCFDCAAKNIL